ncbi:MAG: bacteriohemerythrin [Terracidiphilus sp.]
MPLIAWNDALSVGVQSIDAQHRKLVDTLNELHDAMLAGKARNLTGPILEKLLNYTHDHFASEEAMMAAANYTGLAAHKLRHGDLTRQVEGYIARFQQGEITLNLHLMHFLRDWLTHHIQEEDRDYGPAMQARGLR